MLYFDTIKENKYISQNDVEMLNIFRNLPRLSEKMMLS